MAAPRNVVTGFNHNIKHKGKVFHVQTEDSGVSNPHIITHLFVGGNILASKKTSYADITGAENLTQVVRELMEEQHKEMLRNLINGVYDDVDAAYGEKAAHYQPGELGGDVAHGGPAPVQIQVPVGGPPPIGPSRPSPPPIGPARASPAPHVPPQPGPARPPTLPPTRLPPEVLAARSAPPPELHGDPNDTVIGEDLISEKTLDEVILSYLAEDLGEKK